MTKRILGYLLIVLALILTIGIVGQIPELFRVIIKFFMIFTGKLDGYQGGEAFGSFIVWVFYFILTITLWKYGKKWIKKKATTPTLTDTSYHDGKGRP